MPDLVEVLCLFKKSKSQIFKFVGSNQQIKKEAYAKTNKHKKF